MLKISTLFSFLFGIYEHVNSNPNILELITFDSSSPTSSLGLIHMTYTTTTLAMIDKNFTMCPYLFQLHIILYSSKLLFLDFCTVTDLIPLVLFLVSQTKYQIFFSIWLSRTPLKHLYHITPPCLRCILSQRESGGDGNKFITSFKILCTNSTFTTNVLHQFFTQRYICLALWHAHLILAVRR